MNAATWARGMRAALQQAVQANPTATFLRTVLDELRPTQSPARILQLFNASESADRVGTHRLASGGRAHEASVRQIAAALADLGRTDRADRTVAK